MTYTLEETREMARLTERIVKNLQTIVEMADYSRPFGLDLEEIDERTMRIVANLSGIEESERKSNA